MIQKATFTRLMPHDDKLSSTHLLSTHHPQPSSAHASSHHPCWHSSRHHSCLGHCINATSICNLTEKPRGGLRWSDMALQNDLSPECCGNITYLLEVVDFTTANTCPSQHSCHIMAKLEDCTEIDRTCKIAHTLGGRAARCLKKPVAKTKPSPSTRPPAANNKPVARRSIDTPDYERDPTFGASDGSSPEAFEEPSGNMDSLTVSKEQELAKKCKGANQKFPMQSICQRNWIVSPSSHHSTSSLMPSLMTQVRLRDQDHHTSLPSAGK